VIERCIKLWSAPGDTVFSPFGGIGSEGYQAIRFGRKALLCELKDSYWRVGCRNLAEAEMEWKNRHSTLL
jgi:DNA modification methylase